MSERIIGTGEHLYDVRYANGLWMINGANGTILTSSDGISWTARDSGTEEYLYNAHHANGLLVVIGENGTILTSTDGLSWTARDSEQRSTSMMCTTPMIFGWLWVSPAPF